MSPLCDYANTCSLHLLHHGTIHQTLCCYLCPPRRGPDRDPLPPAPRTLPSAHHHLPKPSPRPVCLPVQAKPADGLLLILRPSTKASYEFWLVRRCYSLPSTLRANLDASHGRRGICILAASLAPASA